MEAESFFERGKIVSLGNCPAVSCDIFRIYPDKENLKQQKSLGKLNFFVFLPGNPGLLDFYTTFLNDIHHNAGKLFVLGIGHFGHSKTALLNLDYYTGNVYESEIAQKIKVLLDELSEVSRTIGCSTFDITFCGHSFGARVCLEVMDVLIKKRNLTDDKFGLNVETKKLLEKENLKINISGFFGVCPTIVDIGKSLLGQKLLQVEKSKFFIFAGLLILRFLLLLLSLLEILDIPNKFMKLYFKLRKVKDIDSHYIGVATRLLDYRILKFALYMGFEEMHKLAALPDDLIDNLVADSTKITMLMAQNDGWVGEENEETVGKLLSETENVKNLRKGCEIVALEPRIIHAFCLSNYGHKHMAELITGRLNPES